MSAIIKETNGLGIGKAGLVGITPNDEAVTEGWYSSGREPHREDGKPSGADFLPANMTTTQSAKEEMIMPTSPSVKTPGSTVSANPTTPKKGPNNNLNKNTGSTPPKSGGALK